MFNSQKENTLNQRADGHRFEQICFVSIKFVIENKVHPLLESRFPISIDLSCDRFRDVRAHDYFSLSYCSFVCTGLFLIIFREAKRGGVYLTL